MFGWEFPPHITGGLGTACQGIVTALAQQNIDISFVVPKIFGDEYQNQIKLVSASDIEINKNISELKEFWKNIKYMEVGSHLIPYVSEEEYYTIVSKSKTNKVDFFKTLPGTKYNFTGKYGQDLYSEVTRYALIASVIASNNNYDVIHAHDWLTYPAGIAAKNVSSKPLVIHVHATEFDRSGENINQNVFDIEKKGMEAADRIITVSNLTRNTVIKKYGIKSSKVITVHNGVKFENNLSALKNEKNVPEKIVTFLGRITFQKGPEYFVEAANKVLSKYKNVRFVMAGSGDMQQQMIKRVAELRIGDKFHFTGFLKENDVSIMFAQSDVYVMPSVSEPFGISPLEALSANVPVIISKQSGVAEVLKHAIKVDFWNVDALADSIYGLLNYNALSNLFRKNGQHEIINLNWEKAALKIKQIYESVA